MKAITENQYYKYNNEYKGYCIKCNKFTSNNCEPDARNYLCPKCKSNNVFGVSECLIAGYITIK